jgi:hypothetical protein
MGRRLDAVMKGDNVWVSEVLQYLDFAIEVFLQFLVQSGEFDGFDCDRSTRNLNMAVSHLPRPQAITRSS